MAKTDIIKLAKPLLYGSGLGEKPSLVRAAASASISTTGAVTTFNLLAGDGAKVRAGDILSVLGATDESDAFVCYVIGVATDTVTVTFIDGSAVPTGTDLDSAVLELNPFVHELALARAIGVVFDFWFYPHIFTFNNALSYTPNLTDGQVEVAASVREILSAHQVVNGTVYPIQFNLMRNMHTTLSSTGSLATFWAMDGSTIYVTGIEEYDDTTADLTIQYLAATGAAALAMDGTAVEISLESAKKDSQNRNPTADALWRSFLSQRQALAEERSRDSLRLEIVR